MPHPLTGRNRSAAAQATTAGTAAAGATTAPLAGGGAGPSRAAPSRDRPGLAGLPGMPESVRRNAAAHESASRLRHAILDDRSALRDQLLAHGARPDKRSRNGPLGLGNQGRAAVHTAAGRGVDAAHMKALIAHDPTIVNVRMGSEQDPLQPLSRREATRGDTPLHQAIRNGNVGVLRVLLETPGIDINRANEARPSQTPVQLLTHLLNTINTRPQAERAEIRSLADVMAKHGRVLDPVHQAAGSNDPGQLRTLIRTGADINRPITLNGEAPGTVWHRPWLGDTPLQWAMRNTSVAAVRTLLNAPGIDIHRTNHAGLTALQVLEALEGSRLSPTQRRELDAIRDLVDNHGYLRPVHAAAGRGIPRAEMEDLIAGGANVNEQVPAAAIGGFPGAQGQPQSVGDTAFIQAIRHRNVEVVRLLLEAPGIDLTLANANGQTGVDCLRQMMTQERQRLDQMLQPPDAEELNRLQRIEQLRTAAVPPATPHELRDLQRAQQSRESARSRAQGPIEREKLNELSMIAALVENHGRQRQPLEALAERGVPFEHMQARIENPRPGDDFNAPLVAANHTGAVAGVDWPLETEGDRLIHHAIRSGNWDVAGLLLNVMETRPDPQDPSREIMDAATGRPQLFRVVNLSIQNARGQSAHDLMERALLSMHTLPVDEQLKMRAIADRFGLEPETPVDELPAYPGHADTSWIVPPPGSPPGSASA